jgi:hypothetical protein
MLYLDKSEVSLRRSTEHFDQHAPGVLNLEDDYGEIREAVRRICAEYPGAYWPQDPSRS